MSSAATPAARLRTLPARIVGWGDFRRSHPAGLVLTCETGYSRPYGSNPYRGYDDVFSPPFFPAKNGDDHRLPPKERVVYIARGRDAVAVPLSTLARRRQLSVSAGGLTFAIRFRPGVNSPLDGDRVADGRDVGSVAVTAGGRAVAFTEPFWFAVAAFRPDVKVVR